MVLLSQLLTLISFVHRGTWELISYPSGIPISVNSPEAAADVLPGPIRAKVHSGELGNINVYTSSACLEWIRTRTSKNTKCMTAIRGNNYVTTARRYKSVGDVYAMPFPACFNGSYNLTWRKQGLPDYCSQLGPTWNLSTLFLNLDFVGGSKNCYNQWGLICCRFCLALCRPLQL
jgi:hypothetical protein